MTEELKTVKDLRHKDNKSVMGETYLIREDRLREEAIKDIKELIKTKGFLEIFNCEVEPLIEYIKWKFNITEEELK